MQTGIALQTIASHTDIFQRIRGNNICIIRQGTGGNQYGNIITGNRIIGYRWNILSINRIDTVAAVISNCIAVNCLRYIVLNI